MNIRKLCVLAMTVFGILMLIGCGQNASDVNRILDNNETEIYETEEMVTIEEDAIGETDITDENVKEETTMLLIDVNGTTLEAELVDNSSARALAELIGDGEVTLELRDYANMEKVGSLPQSIPTNDESISTDYGDIILYQGNQFVLYYDKNSWSFTRLGHVNGVSKEELKEILGTGDVSISLRIDN